MSSNEDFSVVTRVGFTKDDNYSVYVEISYKRGRLSLAGVVAPKASGDAVACGQIYDYLLELSSPTPTSRKIYDIWKRWHLNDMNAHCEHQIAIHGWDPKEEFNSDVWTMNPDSWSTVEKITQEAVSGLSKEGFVWVTPEEQELLKLPRWVYAQNHQEYREYLDKGIYKILHKRTATAGGTNFKDHPKGLLGKPCPTCGYKYGTDWKREEVPQDVLDFLRTLSDSSDFYPWKKFM